jgi:hypothetical protein
MEHGARSEMIGEARGRQAADMENCSHGSASRVHTSPIRQAQGRLRDGYN